jgi:hypothetical protein
MSSIRYQHEQPVDELGGTLIPCLFGGGHEN